MERTQCSGGMFRPKSKTSFIIFFFFIVHLHCIVSDLNNCETPSPYLEPFLDSLTFPPTIPVSNRQQLTLGAFKITQKLHRHLPSTTLYAFGTSQTTATYPGPTLEAFHGIPAYVRWENHIPDANHFLGVDDAIPWANPSEGGVPIVPHLHGGEVESASDGNPDAWFTPSNETGSTYVKQDYVYPNAQTPAALWYHDHTLGLTRLNLFAGLMGFYILKDSIDEPPGIPLLIRDWRFLPNGELNFPMYMFPDNTSWCAEYGDILLVNGKVSPFLTVLPRQYRFRLLNACNARFLELTLSYPELFFSQIGTDGGLLPEATRVTSLLLSPGERVDVLIDFSALENGAEVVLINTAPAPFPEGKLAYLTNGTFQALKFVVDNATGTTQGLLDSLAVLKFPRHHPRAAPMGSVVNLTRNLTLRSFQGKPNHLVLNNLSWSDPVDQFPIVGSTEIWELINLDGDAHNMHLHLVQFQILNQQSFSTKAYEEGDCAMDLPYPDSGSCFTDYPQVPDEEFEQAWKDTVIAWPRNVTRLLIRFASRDGSSFPFDATSGPGYLWHCHTTDHEDYEMMRPFQLQSSDALTGPVISLGAPMNLKPYHV